MTNEHMIFKAIIIFEFILFFCLLKKGMLVDTALTDFWHYVKNIGQF